MSPDGSQVVYATTRHLSLRPVDRLEAMPIVGTTADGRAADPFFSPDAQWVGYQAGGQLKKISIDGGVPIVLGDADRLWGASWGNDGTILFGQGGEGIWQVPDTGGTPEQVLAVAAGELGHGPQMLPGGEWMLLTVRPANTSGWDEAQIIVQSVVSGEREVLIDGGHDGRYLPTGHLIFARNGILFGVPFDPDLRAVTGAPVSLVEGVQDSTVGLTGGAHFAVADAGALVYVPGRAGATEVELVWVDRAGQIQPLAAEPRGYTWARVSPDGTRVALDAQGEGNPDIWIYDLTRDTLTRLTFDDAADAFPIWTPDGSRVVFSSDRDGGGLFWKAADGTGDVERLLENVNAPRPYGWSADGRLVFDQTPGDIGVVAVEGDGTTELLLNATYRESDPSNSPDGHWIAYDSTESGNSEIFVRPFPDIDNGKWQISSELGFDPVWSPDGRELFFLGVGDALWVAQVETEPTFNASRPVRVFSTSEFPVGRGTEYDIAPDGDRFIFQRRLGEDAIPHGLIFVLNWVSELQARVPTGR